MPVEKATDALFKDVMAFEQRLRTGARGVAADGELSGLLQRIARRRHARVGVGAPPLQAAAVQLNPRAQSATPAQPASNAAPGSVLSISHPAAEVCVLQVARPAGFTFLPGQHVKLGLQNGPKNPYTIASAPGDPYLEFCIERVAGGRLTPRLFALSAGARLDVGGKASGEFVLAPQTDLHIMLATVTGISPFRSMLRHAASQRAWPGRFVVLHGASFADELVYAQELQSMALQFPQNLRYMPSVSRPADARNSGFAGVAGRVADLAPVLVRELQARRPGRIQVYACGNPEMVAAAHETIGALGVPVVSEVFD